MKRIFALALLALMAAGLFGGAGLAEGDNAAPPEAAEPSPILVVYFSCTGTTKAIAEQAAALTGADLYEIVPEEAYTEADLNYRDNNSRSTYEMSDESARPAIQQNAEGEDNIPGMAGYEVVFLGYPIWWGEAPRIINTFLESYDFAGKTIVPFCTSGGSGVGSSAERLHALCDETAVWLEGTRLRSGADAEAIRAWIEGLGLETVTIVEP